MEQEASIIDLKPVPDTEIELVSCFNNKLIKRLSRAISQNRVKLESKKFGSEEKHLESQNTKKSIDQLKSNEKNRKILSALDVHYNKNQNKMSKKNNNIKIEARTTSNNRIKRNVSQKDSKKENKPTNILRDNINKNIKTKINSKKRSTEKVPKIVNQTIEIHKTNVKNRIDNMKPEIEIGRNYITNSIEKNEKEQTINIKNEITTETNFEDNCKENVISHDAKPIESLTDIDTNDLLEKLTPKQSNSFTPTTNVTQPTTTSFTTDFLPKRSFFESVQSNFHPISPTYEDYDEEPISEDISVETTKENTQYQSKNENFKSCMSPICIALDQNTNPNQTFLSHQNKKTSEFNKISYVLPPKSVFEQAMNTIFPITSKLKELDSDSNHFTWGQGRRGVIKESKVGGLNIIKSDHKIQEKNLKPTKSLPKTKTSYTPELNTQNLKRIPSLRFARISSLCPITTKSKSKASLATSCVSHGSRWFRSTTH